LAAFDFEKLIAGGSAPCTLGYFLCSRKEKYPKESAPDGATASLRFSPIPARAPTRRAQTMRLGLEHEARDFSGTGCDARARHTGGEQNLATVWFLGPVVTNRPLRIN